MTKLSPIPASADKTFSARNPIETVYLTNRATTGVPVPGVGKSLRRPGLSGRRIPALRPRDGAAYRRGAQRP